MIAFMNRGRVRVCLEYIKNIEEREGVVELAPRISKKKFTKVDIEMIETLCGELNIEYDTSKLTLQVPLSLPSFQRYVVIVCVRGCMESEEFSGVFNRAYKRVTKSFKSTQPYDNLARTLLLTATHTFPPRLVTLPNSRFIVRNSCHLTALIELLQSEEIGNTYHSHYAQTRSGYAGVRYKIGMLREEDTGDLEAFFKRHSHKVPKTNPFKVGDEVVVYNIYSKKYTDGVVTGILNTAGMYVDNRFLLVQNVKKKGGKK